MYLYSRGYRILQAIIDNLKAKGMSSATDVILTGCSGEFMNQKVTSVFVMAHVV